MTKCGVCNSVTAGSEFCFVCGAPLVKELEGPRKRAAAQPLSVPTIQDEQSAAPVEKAATVADGDADEEPSGRRLVVGTALILGLVGVGWAIAAYFGGQAAPTVAEGTTPPATSQSSPKPAPPAPPPVPATPQATVTVTASPSPTPIRYVDASEFVEGLYVDWSARDQASLSRKISPAYLDAFPNSLLDSQGIVRVTSYNNVEFGGTASKRVCGSQQFVKSNGLTQEEYRCFMLRETSDGSWVVDWTGDQATIREWS